MDANDQRQLTPTPVPIPMPELLETVRSAPSGVGSHGPSSASGVTSAVAGRMRVSRPPTDLLVSLPAGSGGGAGTQRSGLGAPGAARSQAPADSAVGGSGSEQQHQTATSLPSPPTGPCRRCRDLEAELKQLRAELRQANSDASDRERRYRASDEEARRQTGRVREAAMASESAAAHAEHALKLACAELDSEAAAARAGGAAAAEARSWHVEARVAFQRLAEAEKSSEANAAKAAKALRQLSDLERQQRDLAKQAGSAAPHRFAPAHRLRSELEAANHEKDELDRRLKKMLPRLERLASEESRLRGHLTEESEMAALHFRTAHVEATEASKAKEHQNRLRRSCKTFAEEREALQAELQELELQRRVAQVELSKSQRLRQEEAKKQKSATQERDAMRKEIDSLQEQLKRPAEASVVAVAFAASAPALHGVPAAAPPKKEDKLYMPLRRSPVQVPYDTFVEPSSTSDPLKEWKASAFNDAPGWSEASAKLFEMIERAKERADKRKNLSGAAEEVKAKAKSLEELLTKDAALTV